MPCPPPPPAVRMPERECVRPARLPLLTQRRSVVSCLRQSASLVLTAVVLLLCCAAADPPAKPTKEQIAKWVQQLGDDDFSTREEASKKLYETGQPAEEALQAAARSDDAEVARRAGEIMDKFKW